MASSPANELNPADLQGTAMHELLQTLKECSAKDKLSPRLLAFLEFIASRVDAGKRVIAFDEDQELTPAQAAKVLGVSRSYVSRLIRNGRLKARKVGAHPRISVKEVVAASGRHKALQRVLDAGKELEDDFL